MTGHELGVDFRKSSLTGMGTMEDPKLVERVIRLTLEINKSHWLKHGMPIKPEDSAMVLLDVLSQLGAERAVPPTEEPNGMR
jgi:hypothetical protein